MFSVIKKKLFFVHHPKRWETSNRINSCSILPIHFSVRVRVKYGLRGEETEPKSVYFQVACLFVSFFLSFFSTFNLQLWRVGRKAWTLSICKTLLYCFNGPSLTHSHYKKRFFLGITMFLLLCALFNTCIFFALYYK